MSTLMCDYATGKVSFGKKHMLKQACYCIIIIFGWANFSNSSL